MNSYIVVYDLHEEGQNYACLYKKLKLYPTHWHMQRSVWIIATTQSAAQIRDNLRPCLDSNDKLFVGALRGEAAWIGFTQKATQWLKGLLE